MPTMGAAFCGRHSLCMTRDLLINGQYAFRMQGEHSRGNLRGRVCGRQVGRSRLGNTRGCALRPIHLPSKPCVISSFCTKSKAKSAIWSLI